jgi:hypothetical protein
MDEQGCDVRFVPEADIPIFIQSPVGADEQPP